MNVALKDFRRDVRSLENELKALLKLNHPNVIKVLDFYKEPYPCLVTIFIDGRTLSEHLEGNKGPLPAAMAMKVLRGIGEGLKYIHKEHVVHRDLKPDNIILEVLNDGELRPVLIDFGLGKTAESTSMMQGSTVHRQGTYHWMAPEMLSQNERGNYKWRKEVDVYALGIIMWQIFTGEKLYAGIGMPHPFMANVVDGSLRPSLTNTKASPHLIGLMQKCWDGDYKQRPSAEEFLNQLSLEKNAVSTANEGSNQESMDVDGSNTAKDAYYENLLSNSIATMKSVKIGRANSSAIGGIEQAADTKSTGGQTTLDEDTEAYGRDPKDIQVSTFKGFCDQVIVFIQKHKAYSIVNSIVIFRRMRPSLFHHGFH